MGSLFAHYTPKQGSWLNQAEIEIGLFARRCLGRRRTPDLKTLRGDARDQMARIVAGSEPTEEFLTGRVYHWAGRSPESGIVAALHELPGMFGHRGCSSDVCGRYHL
jgi:hypothetical protein